MDVLHNKPNGSGKKTNWGQKENGNMLLQHGKIPPQSLDIEEAVLGALMLEKNALTAVIDILNPDVFYKDAHKYIFEAVHALFSKSEPIDILTVTNELKNSNRLDIVGGPYYITQLTNRVASTANIEFHSRILMQKYIQREMIRIGSEIIKDGFEDSTDVFDLMDKAERELFSISEKNFRRASATMQSLVREAVTEIEGAKDQEGHLSGVPSGFTQLDRLTGGWQKSDLIVLAARPGMGKTAFILSMARNIAVDFKRPIAIFSLEMAGVQLVTRIISAEAQLPGDKLRKGNLEDYEWQQLNSKLNNLIDAPLFIDDTPALSIFELRAKCRRLKEQHNIEMIMIDYLQLMSAGIQTGNREQEISTISRSLKSLAKELNVPVIALSQLSRSVETRGGNKKPILSDLRESGAIEQDADMVCFVYRPEYYKIYEDEDGNPTEGTGEILIAKNRHGALEDIRLRFIPHFAKFQDLESNESGMDMGYDQMEPNSDFGNEGPTTYTIPSKMNDDSVPF
ncbi:MAG: replicative DNA helicase [Bacteroidales bacterium]|nr:replicative DNA helicase [Bacteroidales bacterium]